MVDSAFPGGPAASAPPRSRSTFASTIVAGDARLRHALESGAALPWMYWGMPHERDADAAATAFASRRGMRARGVDLSWFQPRLFASPWPPPNLIDLGDEKLHSRCCTSTL